MLLKKVGNVGFYCTTIEITWGPKRNPGTFTGPKENVPVTGMPETSDKAAWTTIINTMKEWQSVSLMFFANDMFQQFLECKEGNSPSKMNTATHTLQLG